jgi:predicted MFS family arabinose efflux permease
MATTPSSISAKAPLSRELALAVAVAVAFADSAIVVLALPELYVDFKTSIPGVAWVVTAYNVAVVVGIAALLPFAARARPARIALLGLLIFFAASVASAAAPGLAALVAGRAAQGLGAALLLGSSLPLMVALSGTRERAVALWVGAGTVGTAVGPALGGFLTEALGWRAIFAVQAPVAGVALLAALQAPVTAASPRRKLRARPPIGPALGLGLLFAALVGALFLAVLLLVTVWDYGPLAGAGMVSALPLAALAARPLSRRLPARADVVAGCLLLAAGLGALALLPASEPAYAVCALALSGAGLGLALPPLTRASLADEGDLGASGVFSIGLRHFGLVAGLLAVAPLLAGELQEAGDRATQNATAVILDARLPLERKVPIALDLYDAFQRTPNGEIPDLAAPFEANGAAREPRLREVRDALLASVEAPLTRAFRSSFELAALFALLAGALVIALDRRRRV